MTFLVSLPEPYNLQKYVPNAETAKALLACELEALAATEPEQIEVITNSSSDSEMIDGSKTCDSVFDVIFQSGSSSQCELVAQNCPVELDVYLKDSYLSLDCDPLIYWRKNQKTFPALANLARVYLAIPASSGGVERVFSVAGAIARARRARITVETLEAVLLTREEKRRLSSCKM